MPAFQPGAGVPPQAATPLGNTAQPVSNGSSAPSSLNTTFFTALADVLNVFPPGTFPHPGVQAASGATTPPEDPLTGSPQDTPNPTAVPLTHTGQGFALNPPSLNAALSTIDEGGSGGSTTTANEHQDNQSNVALTHPLPSFIALAQALSVIGPPPGFPGSLFTASSAAAAQLSNTPFSFVEMFSALHNGDFEDESAGLVDGEGESEDEGPILPPEQTAWLTLPPTVFQAVFMANLIKYKGNMTSGHQNSTTTESSSSTTLEPSPAPPGDAVNAQDDTAGVSNVTTNSQGGGTLNSQTTASVPLQPSPFEFTFVPASEHTPNITPNVSSGQPSAPVVNPWVSFSMQDFITAMPDALNATTFAELWPALNAFAQTLINGSHFALPLPPVPILPLNFTNLFGPRRPRFNATAFVDTLERVHIFTIAAHDMRCPYCWLPFGTTDEDDPAFVYAPDQDDPPELAERQIGLRELPFCAGRADNDPVRTPCGHLFGRGCLIESMEKVDTLCPICRQELLPKPEVPA